MLTCELSESQSSRISLADQKPQESDVVRPARAFGRHVNTRGSLLFTGTPPSAGKCIVPKGVVPKKVVWILSAEDVDMFDV